jgi:hypothetical protein
MCEETLGSPITHADHGMVALLENVAQPNTQHGAHAGPFPVAMRVDMGVDQVANAHIVDDAEQQRQAIDLLGGNGQFWLCHTVRVTHPARTWHPKCANRKLNHKTNCLLCCNPERLRRVSD